MILTLLGHQWKSFWRSRHAGKSLAMQIFIGFITLFLLAYALAFGFLIKEIIIKVFPKQDLVNTFLGFLLYYFAFDLMTRFMIQELPALSIQPYLLQNMRRSRLIRFLNIRSLFTVFNLIPFLLFLPFTVITISKQYPALATLSFFVTVLSVMIFNHFLVLYIKRKSILNNWWLVLFFLGITILFGLDYVKIFSLSRLSTKIFWQVLQFPWLLLLGIGFAALSFINNDRFLLKNLYLEDIVAKGKRKAGADYAFLTRFGTIGELIGLEIKMIMRNKRPRYIAVLSGLFLFYGFIFYKNNYILTGQPGMLAFGGLFLTGIFINNYGQFLFAWQSGHFDGMMVTNLQIRTYIKSKFLLFTVVSTLSLLLASFYGLFSWKILLIQLSGYLYNVGLNTVMAVYFATYNYKGLDITQKASFNFQGIGAAQWLYSLISMAIPMIIYWIFALLINGWAAIIAIGMLGLAGFLLQDWWIEQLTKEFEKRKYKILEGFREI